MSSKPSEEGIRELRKVLDRLAIISAEASSLGADVREKQARLTKLQDEHDALAEQVPKMLQAMDIAANGNFGWHSRIVWALRELASQYRAVGGP